MDDGRTEQSGCQSSVFLFPPEFMGMDMEENIEKGNQKAKNREFTKGVLFGILVSAVCFMALFLMENGTVGAKGQDAGASVLSSRETQEKLREIREKIEDSFFFEVDGEKLSTALFKGLMAGLEDPYASYYTAAELENVVSGSEGSYYGIGISLRRDPDTGRFWVEHIYEESPAWEAGMQAGDELLEADGMPVEGMLLEDVVALLKERQETALFLKRDGETYEVSLQPATVEIPTIAGQMLPGQTGYIRIREFDTITVSQFETVLAELESEGQECLVIDVRDNPGGNLDSVCGILDQLLGEGLIVYTETKDGKREERTSDEEHRFTKPLAVLVNGKSASASEIFAGAIQDYGLGPVVGTQTYGKGVVQRTYLLEDGSAIKLTTEKYYTPKGQDINGNGITPDVIVEEASSETSQEKLPGESEEVRDGELSELSASELEADPVLRKALDLLNEKRMQVTE